MTNLGAFLFSERMKQKARRQQLHVHAEVMGVHNHAALQIEAMRIEALVS